MIRYDMICRFIDTIYFVITLVLNTPPQSSSSVSDWQMHWSFSSVICPISVSCHILYLQLFFIYLFITDSEKSTGKGAYCSILLNTLVFTDLA